MTLSILFKGAAATSNNRASVTQQQQQRTSISSNGNKCVWRSLRKNAIKTVRAESARERESERETCVQEKRLM